MLVKVIVFVIIFVWKFRLIDCGVVIVVLLLVVVIVVVVFVLFGNNVKVLRVDKDFVMLILWLIFEW